MANEPTQEKQSSAPKIDDLLLYHQNLCSWAREIMKEKNHDYTSGSLDSIFANFERSELMGVCSVETSFLVRIIDKLSRLSTFVSTGTLKVKSESYNDAILDLINYLILFGAYEHFIRGHNHPFGNADISDSESTEKICK